MNITKTQMQQEVSDGGSSKEIAKRMGMPHSTFLAGCKTFGINLHQKPRVKVTFVDDTTSFTGTIETPPVYAAAVDIFANQDVDNFERSSSAFETTLVK